MSLRHSYIKNSKELSDEFHALRNQLYNNKSSDASLNTQFNLVKSVLEAHLQEKLLKAKEIIAKSEDKKNKLIKDLQTIAKEDTYLQDEIIQELEEYSRMKRYFNAQLAKLSKQLEDISLSPEAYSQKIHQSKISQP